MNIPPIVIWLFLSIATLSCATVPSKRYYTLSNNTTGTAKQSHRSTCALPLVVASVMAASPYEDDKIVFRTNEFEIRYYNYRFWVVSPEKMIMGLLQMRMTHSGLFQTVEYRINSASEHLALYVKLNAIEELDRQDQWYARLAMSFVLKTSQREDVVWTHSFDVQRPATRQSTLDIVATLNGIYNSEMDNAAASLSEFLSSYAGCRYQTKVPILKDDQ